MDRIMKQIAFCLILVLSISILPTSIVRAEDGWWIQISARSDIFTGTGDSVSKDLDDVMEVVKANPSGAVAKNWPLNLYALEGNYLLKENGKLTDFAVMEDNYRYCGLDLVKSSLNPNDVEKIEYWINRYDANTPVNRDSEFFVPNEGIIETTDSDLKLLVAKPKDMVDFKSAMPITSPSTQFLMIDGTVYYKNGDITSFSFMPFVYRSQLSVHVMDFIAPFKTDEPFSVYRLYNMANGEHLYTIDTSEAKNLVEKSGWKQEKSQGMAAESGVAIYRLSNPTTGEHLYTSDVNEVTVQQGNGWKADNGGKAVFYGHQKGNTAVYRLFNPNAPSVSCHHYTSDANEIRVLTVNGWQMDNEGSPVYYLN